MLASILSCKASVLATQGNFNNDIGVPLTLFGLGDEHQYAVIEMGANHTREIEWLSEIAQPTVAVITQCAPAHLEGFGTIEGVANAKAEIFSGLLKDGIAVINGDDDFSDLWLDKSRHNNQLTFGLGNRNEVTAESIRIEDIVSGIKDQSQVTREPDRRKAIRQAIHSASGNDVVLIAGKGHEDYQEIAGVRTPLSDRSIVEEVLDEPENGNNG